MRDTMSFFVYILRMNNGHLYGGHSNSLSRRHTEHTHGKGCRTTGIFGAGDIIFAEEHPDRPSATALERQIKGWTRAKKLALASGKLKTLHALATRRKPEPMHDGDLYITNWRSRLKFDG